MLGLTPALAGRALRHTGVRGNAGAHASALIGRALRHSGSEGQCRGPRPALIGRALRQWRRGRAGAHAQGRALRHRSEWCWAHARASLAPELQLEPLCYGVSHELIK